MNFFFMFVSFTTLLSQIRDTVLLPRCDKRIFFACQTKGRRAKEWLMARHGNYVRKNSGHKTHFDEKRRRRREDLLPLSAADR